MVEGRRRCTYPKGHGPLFVLHLSLKINCDCTKRNGLTVEPSDSKILDKEHSVLKLGILDPGPNIRDNVGSVEEPINCL